MNTASAVVAQAPYTVATARIIAANALADDFMMAAYAAALHPRGATIVLFEAIDYHADEMVARGTLVISGERALALKMLRQMVEP